jgi:hypothetical protein
MNLQWQKHAELAKNTHYKLLFIGAKQLNNSANDTQICRWRTLEIRKKQNGFINKMVINKFYM